MLPVRDFAIPNSLFCSRSKLLCVMAHRIQHLVSALDLSSTTEPVVAPNGLPLPVAVGLLRGATTWSVLFMWRHSETGLCWRRLFENQNLDTPAGLLNYATFMFRLYSYGHLFARAVRYLLTGKVPCLLRSLFSPRISITLYLTPGGETQGRGRG